MPEATSPFIAVDGSSPTIRYKSVFSGQEFATVADPESISAHIARRFGESTMHQSSLHDDLLSVLTQYHQLCTTPGCAWCGQAFTELRQGSEEDRAAAVPDVRDHIFACEKSPLRLVTRQLALATTAAFAALEFADGNPLPYELQRSDLDAMLNVMSLPESEREEYWALADIVIQLGKDAADLKATQEATV